MNNAVIIQLFNIENVAIMDTCYNPVYYFKGAISSLQWVLQSRASTVAITGCL